MISMTYNVQNSLMRSNAEHNVHEGVATEGPNCVDKFRNLLPFVPQLWQDDSLATSSS